ncbi:hypothetical protein DWY95_08890 [Faecalibacterium sp. AF28-13AC]|nr:hypothetical protein DWY95_08890 [Faecalibacterium sp. AF28-13AC]
MQILNVRNVVTNGQQLSIQFLAGMDVQSVVLLMVKKKYAIISIVMALITYENTVLKIVKMNGSFLLISIYHQKTLALNTTGNNILCLLGLARV